MFFQDPTLVRGRTVSPYRPLTLPMSHSLLDLRGLIYSTPFIKTTQGANISFL